ncbi:MAG TPA: DUF6101 family protein [Devosiaceae bacterium]|nr:DUF6101 family protein [Devosiaceae bacterium]
MRGDATGTAGVEILSGRAGTCLPRLRAANENDGDGAGSETRTVTIRRTLKLSGVTVKLKVPVDDFVGVAVSTTINEEGVLRSAIELIHPDCELNYRVFEEEGNNTVVAEWQNWGRQLDLPLYIRGGNGDLIAYSQQVGGVLFGETAMRRRLSSDADRRPRFLNRRELGIVVSN